MTNIPTRSNILSFDRLTTKQILSLNICIRSCMVRHTGHGDESAATAVVNDSICIAARIREVCRGVMYNTARPYKMVHSRNHYLPFLGGSAALLFFVPRN